MGLLQKTKAAPAVEEAEETALVPHENGEVPAYMQDVEGDTGLDNIEQSELGVPRIDLLQAMSDAVEAGEGKPGQFRLNVTGQLFDEMDIMVVLVTKGKVNFVDREVFCRSFDGVNSDPQVSTQVQELCEDCPALQWGENNEPPACSETYNAFMVIVTEGDYYGTPFWFTAKRTSLKPFRAQVLQPLKFRKPGLACAFKFHLKAVTKQGPKGSYYVPQFKLLEHTSEKEFKAAREQYMPLAERMSFMAVVRAEEAAGIVEQGENGDLAPDDDIPL